jgi:S-formylglutathione hydrolase
MDILMKQISATKAFGGTQYVYSHFSEACRCDMTFAVFMPPQAAVRKVPVLWYLSGLTCTHQNVMDKGEYRQIAAELGVAVVCPDTSPRGDGVADEPENWQFGKGAGFYLDATIEPFAQHYNMQRYIVE